MKLGYRIFLGYFLITAVAGFFLLKSAHDQLKPAVRQATEEVLVDTANLLAEIIQKDLRKEDIKSSDFSKSVQTFLERKPHADIWGVEKIDIVYRIYITDDQGVVIYDSDGQKAVGQDYSRWNDVYLTLQGKYGARSTKIDPDNELTSVMHVAAPIKQDGQIVGVLTVSKPNISVLPFIELTRNNMAQAGIFLFALSLFFGGLISGFLTRSVRRLSQYASDVHQGKKAVLPIVPERELSQLGKAIEQMRIELEGKEYAEKYVHSLTHEIKSPLSGIAAASELLSEDMNVEDRVRFVSNIKEETKRIQDIVDRLLDLARLEKMQELTDKEQIDITALIKDVLDDYAIRFNQRGIQCKNDLTGSVTLNGDGFLVRKAVQNILDNAMDFSKENDVVTITGREKDGMFTLTVKDQGEGIPKYARDKIFDRFYSLPRPDTGQKSSGLGLGFVKEIMSLHRGSIEVQSDDTGCSVSLYFPLQ